MEVKGQNLSKAGDSRTWQSSDFVNNTMPTKLDGVSVTVNGKSAFVYYISPTQVNILTPPDAIEGTVPFLMNSRSGLFLSALFALRFFIFKFCASASRRLFQISLFGGRT